LAATGAASVVTGETGAVLIEAGEDAGLGEGGDKLLKVDVVGNDVEKALKILKRNLSRDGLFREMRNRKFYEKPSVKKKRKQAAARKNKRKMGF
jgi:small subunit ribosomal protein S21